MSDSIEGNQPARTLEQLISDIAEFQKTEDLHLMYQQLRGCEVFLPADVGPRSNIPQGVKYVIGPQDRVSVRMAVGPNQQRCIYAVTHHTHPLLKDGYIGMDWMEALKMSQRLGEDVGVLLQGEKSWVILDCDTVKSVVQLYAV